MTQERNSERWGKNYSNTEEKNRNYTIGSFLSGSQAPHIDILCGGFM